MENSQKKYFGLTEEEVRVSRERHGANVLRRKKRKGFFRSYLASFSDPVIRILLVALALNALFFFKTRNVTETAGIAAAIFLSTFVSTLSEYSGESAFERLTESSKNGVCRVRRGGKNVDVKSEEIVVGDILLLRAGERVPADATLLSGRLSVSQSPLSGESAEVEKTPEVKRGAQGLSRREKVFEGSLIASGEAVARIDAVGENTFYGKIAAELQEDKSDSPLKRKLSRLAGTLSRIGYAAAVLVAFADLFNAFFLDNGMNFALIAADFRNPVLVFSRLTHALTLAIAVVVVAVPEGLPMMIAVVLSSNRLKMAKDHVVVKRAAGIEAAGGMQILFTDKTGTLTKGEARVFEAIDGAGRSFRPKNVPPALRVALAACSYFNGGFFEENAENTGDDKKIPNVGNAADRALYSAFSPSFPEVSRLFSRAEIVRREKFSSDKKYASVTLRFPDASSLLPVRTGVFTADLFKSFAPTNLMAAKDRIEGKNVDTETTFFQGAPELVLPRCAAYFDGDGVKAADKAILIDRLSENARLGRRVLALACSIRGFSPATLSKNAGGMGAFSNDIEKNAAGIGEDIVAVSQTQRAQKTSPKQKYADRPVTVPADSLPDDAVFLGFVVLCDELREEAKRAVADLSAAGVRVVMVTGDHPETACAVAKEAGFFLTSSSPVVLTGEELSSLSDKEVAALLPRLKVVARALPADKSRLVALSQRLGYVVGMTGDGINDAAALKKADAGFALGSGTEVAKEAGDVVIADDNLSSVVKAVAYGRQVFKSIRQFVVFQLTMNFCAAGVSLLAPFFGADTPVTVMQMLWINVIMDTLASLAFAGIKADERDMLRPPLPSSQPVLTARLTGRVAATGGYCVLLCLAFLRSQTLRSYFSLGATNGEERFYAAFFSVFVFSGLFGAFHARTDSPDPFSHMKGGGSFFSFIALTSLCQIALSYFGGRLFRTCPLTLWQLMLTLALSATVLPVGSIVKIVERAVRKKRKKRENFRSRQKFRLFKKFRGKKASRSPSE